MVMIKGTTATVQGDDIVSVTPKMYEGHIQGWDILLTPSKRLMGQHFRVDPAFASKLILSSLKARPMWLAKGSLKYYYLIGDA